MNYSHEMYIDVYVSDQGQSSRVDILNISLIGRAAGNPVRNAEGLNLKVHYHVRSQCFKFKIKIDKRSIFSMIYGPEVKECILQVT